MTTYVLMVSRVYPCYHPRKGQPTYFRSNIDLLNIWDCRYCVYDTLKDCQKGGARCLKVLLSPKFHTIRESVEEWERRAAKINTGEAVLSLRFWVGKPYRSPPGEFIQLTKLGTQRITFYNLTTGLEAYVEERKVPVEVLAKNDGLTVEDFEAWFAPKFKKGNEWTGVILHFTDFRY